MKRLSTPRLPEHRQRREASRLERAAEASGRLAEICGDLDRASASLWRVGRRLAFAALLGLTLAGIGPVAGLTPELLELFRALR